MVAIKHTREKWWNSIAVNPREPFLREIPGNLVRAARIMMSNKRRYTPYAGNPCEGHLRSFFRHPWADHFFFSRGTKGIALTRRMNGGERMHGIALNKRWQNLLYSLGKQFFFFSRLHASSLYRVKKKKKKKECRYIQGWCFRAYNRFLFAAPLFSSSLDKRTKLASVRRVCIARTIFFNTNQYDLKNLRFEII